MFNQTYFLFYGLQVSMTACEAMKSKSVSQSVQFSHSVMSDSLRPHESQMPGLPVHHQLPAFTQTHVHRVSDAIQSSQFGNYVHQSHKEACASTMETWHLII